MTSKEMKLVKFKKIISDMWGNLPGYYRGNENPLCILFGSEWNEEFSSIIINNTFVDTIAKRYYALGLFETSYNDVESLVKVSISATSNYGFDGGNLGAQTVFFGLIALAIDNDSYNEKLNILTDFAYLVKFDEDMMSDWIYAVKSVLTAEMINLSKLKSNNAITFFENFKNAKYQGD